ncbi:MAG: Holliday junction resolvase-like protein [Candidatus Methanoperedens sp.]
MIEWIVVILLVVVLIFLFWKYSELKGEIENRSRAIFEQWRATELEQQTNEKAKLMFQDWKQIEEKNIREDAIKKSQAVIMGKVTEHLVPYFPDFKYNPKDLRFLGTPVDFVVFDGLSDGDVLKKVAFLEVKTGKSAGLSNRERHIRNCIESKNVCYEIIRINKGSQD